MRRRRKDEGGSQRRSVMDRIEGKSTHGRHPLIAKASRLPSGVPSRENLGQPTQGDKQRCRRQQCLLVRLPSVRPTGTPSLGEGRRTVRRLQARIVKAVTEGRWNKAKALVHLLTHSFGGRALAILRVVSNSGARDSRCRRGALEHTGSQVRRFQRPAPARLPTATAPQGVHPQEQRPTRPRDPHDDRSGHAGTLPAWTRPHRGNPGRRPFLWLSAETPLCRCPGAMSSPLEQSSRPRMDPRRGHQSLLRSRIVIPLLETDRPDLPRLELLKCGDYYRNIREQENLPIPVERDLDRALVNPIIDPVPRDLKPLGELRYGEVARDAPRVGLTPLDEDAMAKANDPDRAGQHDGTFRRAVALPGQLLGDFLIRLPLPGQAQDRFLHLLG